MVGSNLFQRLMLRRLRRRLRSAELPEHVGLIIDGNRRWARRAGFANASLGHRAGAEHVGDALAWCTAVGIRHLTVFVCSTENLQRRDSDEIAYLMRLVEEVFASRLPDQGWELHIAGRLDLLPETTAQALVRARDATRAAPSGQHLTLAIGYGGRQEIVDAVRSYLSANAHVGSLEELARTVTEQDIATHLYAPSQPDVDLVVRTSGERRLSNWLLWQSTTAELVFSDAYWPAFREVDFLRALQTFADRKASSRRLPAAS